MYPRDAPRGAEEIAEDDAVNGGDDDAKDRRSVGQHQSAQARNLASGAGCSLRRVHFQFPPT